MVVIVRQSWRVFLNHSVDLIIELSATNARTEPEELAYILANYSPSSRMVGVVCNYARQAPRAASQEARMCDVIARPTVAS